MGLLDFFRKKPRLADKGPEQAAPAHGWDAITRAFEGAYPGQRSPVHRAPRVYRMHDLSENAAAFDGISAYDAGEYWHFVTYGLTELYGKEGEDPLVCGFGYEFTFKLPKVSDAPPVWAFDFLTVAAHVTSGSAAFGSVVGSSGVEAVPGVGWRTPGWLLVGADHAIQGGLAGDIKGDGIAVPKGCGAEGQAEVRKNTCGNLLARGWAMARSTQATWPIG